MGYYVFVDNSNLWIEGKYASAVRKGMAPDIHTAHEKKICDNSWKIDFEKLLSYAVDGDLRLSSLDPSQLKRIVYGSQWRLQDLQLKQSREINLTKKRRLTQESQLKLAEGYIGKQMMGMFLSFF